MSILMNSPLTCSFLLNHTSSLTTNLTVESQFFKPPREMEIGLKTREFEKIKSGNESHLFYCGTVLKDPRKQTTKTTILMCKQSLCTVSVHANKMNSKF